MVQSGTKQFVRDGRALQGIAIMVSIRPGDDVETEFGLLVDTLYQWHDQHGKCCGELTVAFVAKPKAEEQLLAYWLSLIKKEEALRPLFRRLGNVDVALISPDGKNQRQIKFKMSDDDDAA